MSTYIGILVIMAVVAYAIRGTVKRAKGGGCHGGGASVSEPEKKLEGEILGSEVVKVEGMRCEACKSRVEHVINAMNGAACKVDLKEKTATISYDREIDLDEAKRRIEVLGYSVEE